MERLLSSWKEIATYLGKGVRTVQRWERQLGLPVRRPDAAKQHIVFASPVELDAWIASGKLVFTPQQAAESDGLQERLRVLEEENARLRQQLCELQMQIENGQSRRSPTADFGRVGPSARSTN